MVIGPSHDFDYLLSDEYHKVVVVGKLVPNVWNIEPYPSRFDATPFDLRSPLPLYRLGNSLQTRDP